MEELKRQKTSRRVFHKACVRTCPRRRSRADHLMASNGDSVSKLGHLQEQLEGFIENLRTVGVIAGDFQQSGQNVLNERL